MRDMKHFDEILTRVNLAFSKSPTKGVIFWYNMLLDDSDASSDLNKKAWDDLRITFVEKRPNQVVLVERIIDDLRYIREQVLKSDSVRKKVEELKSFLVESIVAEDVIDSLQEHVLMNYDKIKSQIK